MAETTIDTSKLPTLSLSELWTMVMKSQKQLQQQKAQNTALQEENKSLTEQIEKMNQKSQQVSDLQTIKSLLQYQVTSLETQLSTWKTKLQKFESVTEAKINISVLDGIYLDLEALYKDLMQLIVTSESDETHYRISRTSFSVFEHSLNSIALQTYEIMSNPPIEGEQKQWYNKLVPGNIISWMSNETKERKAQAPPPNPPVQRRRIPQEPENKQILNCNKMGWSAAGDMSQSGSALGSDIIQRKCSGIIKSILIKEKSIDSLRYYILEQYNKDLREWHSHIVTTGDRLKQNAIAQIEALKARLELIKLEALGAIQTADPKFDEENKELLQAKNMKQFLSLKQTQTPEITQIQNVIDSQQIQVSLQVNIEPRSILVWFGYDSNKIVMHDVSKARSTTIYTSFTFGLNSYVLLSPTKIFFTGGYFSPNKTYEIDTARKMLIKRADVLTPRYYQALIRFDERIYSFGGKIQQGHQAIRVAEWFYDNRWTQLNDAPVSFGIATGTIFNEKIYLTGSDINWAFAFSPRSGKYHTKFARKVERWERKLIVSTSKSLYIFEGYDLLQSTDHKKTTRFEGVSEVKSEDLCLTYAQNNYGQVYIITRKGELFMWDLFDRQIRKEASKFEQEACEILQYNQ